MSASDPTVAALLGVGRARWPDVAVNEDEFAALVTAKQRAEPDAVLDGAELYLSCACESGDARALAHFETTYFGVIELALAPMKLGSAVIDEVRQLVRTKLLVADGDPPKLRSYAGRGALEGLVRVIATRCALDLVRRAQRETPLGDVADHILAVAVSPELQLVKQRYREQFKVAFTSAIAELSARDRTILKLHLLDRLSIDDIGTLYKVHRATAARWITTIRETLGERTRALLGARAGIAAAELESVVRIVHSQLSLSLSRLLE